MRCRSGNPRSSLVVWLTLLVAGQLLAASLHAHVVVSDGSLSVASAAPTGAPAASHEAGDCRVCRSAFEYKVQPRVALAALPAAPALRACLSEVPRLAAVGFRRSAPARAPPARV